MEDDKEKSNSFVTWGVLFIASMVIVAIIYFNSALPNKDKNSLDGFFWIFSREILGAVFILIIFITMIVVKIHKYLKRKKDKHNA